MLRRRGAFLLPLLLSAVRIMASMPRTSPAPPAAAVVFLHGLGDTPAGWRSLAPQLGPRLEEVVGGRVKWLFPAAPTSKVSISGGALQTSWFDIFDWPIGVSARDDRDGLLASTSKLHEIVAGLEAEGVPADKIVIGGFSQGGAISLLACHRYEKTLAGCVCLSGWLTLKEEWAGARVKDNLTPIFWGHGTEDPVVLPEQVAAGSEVFKNQGPDINLDTRMYPMGHSSHPSEMSDMYDFLASALG